MGRLLDDPSTICLWPLMDHFHLTWKDMPSYPEFERTRDFTVPGFWEWRQRRRRNQLWERVHWEMMNRLLRLSEYELLAERGE